jgi:Family of unknown function (DUF5996)
MNRDEVWPPLPLREWEPTYRTLHRWMQVAGKIRMAQTHLINHWWNVTLYVYAHGLTTSPIPYDGITFEILFDFVKHRLCILTSRGEERVFPLTSESVADFYARVMATLRELGIEIAINTMPSEVADPVPFEEDRQNCTYAAESANRFWRVLVQASRVMTEFRCRFTGKVSPVHFFWGACDLAVTRFSGRLAPPHGEVPNVPLEVVREAYSHEVSSCGFWPGGNGVEAMFYAYAYPEPRGFAAAHVEPPAARYDAAFGEFVLPYEEVRNAASPDDALLAFFQTSYEAAAELGGWDRAALEAAR